jgi:heme-degrading monooxygenase HmoA
MAILEAAMLQVKPGQSEAFEAAFREAQAIISSMPGYRWHQLQRCLDREAHYLLLVEWDSVADHDEGFRKSPQYQQWRRLLHHFYDPFPTVLHYEQVEYGPVTPNLESLHARLDSAAMLLDVAAGEIRDIPLEPAKPSIRRVGEALGQIFDIQREIYRFKPELIPTSLWEGAANADPSSEQIVRGAFRRVETAEAAGDVPMAIKLLEFLLRVQPDGDHVERARDELARLKGKT